MDDAAHCWSCITTEGEYMLLPTHAARGRNVLLL